VLNPYPQELILYLYWLVYRLAPLSLHLLQELFLHLSALSLHQLELILYLYWLVYRLALLSLHLQALYLYQC
jgi:hypothetical protein